MLEHVLNWSPWEKPEEPEVEAEQEDDKSEKDTILFDELDPEPVVQHAFWKGEGDEATIRRDQGIWTLMRVYIMHLCDLLAWRNTHKPVSFIRIET